MAASNKLMKEITDQFLHCKICYEPYKEPKTLVCLHTFCTTCLQKHLDSDNSRSSRFLLYTRYITCPLCRSKTEIPTGGVRRLPDNFLVSSLTDVVDRRRVGKIPPCEICPGERPRLNNCASHKCLDCAKLLCKSCVDLHMTTKVTQQHSLIDIEGEKDIECKMHPEEIVRYYCEPCEECICVVCTFQEHRDHEICSFNDGFSKYKSGLDNLLGQCKDRLVEVQDRVSVINKFETSLKETRESIRDLAISYIQQVRATERQLMQKVEEDFGDKVQGFLQNKEWLVENQDALQTTCNLAEIIMNDRGVEMLLLKKELQTKLSTLLEPALPTVPENLTHDIKFIPGDVKLGHISLNPEGENKSSPETESVTQKHSLNEESNLPSKRRCITKDVQTETSQIPSPVRAKINFDYPDASGVSPQGTKLVNGLSGDNEKMECNRYISKTDVSVNTMCSMLDSASPTFRNESQSSQGACVKCCAELKKGHSLGSLPVVDGSAPEIQDIIITNDGDKERRRRRRSLIKSRRVQTDLSMSLSNESIEDVCSPLRVSSQESLNSSFRLASNQNLLASVSECTYTRSVGLDPIVMDNFSVSSVITKNKGVNTTENVKVVVDTRSVKTNTREADNRDSSTMTVPNSKTTDTQTADKILTNKLIGTDYTGQRNKRTSTPIIVTMESGTCMPSITHEHKVTWTDAIQTTERSICTESSEMVEAETETVAPVLCEKGIGARPDMVTVEINTDPVNIVDGATGGEKEKKSKSKDKEKREKDKSLEKKKSSKEKKERKEKKKYKDSCTETDPVIRNDKETGTALVQVKESWTATVSPQMVNTGITPARPATREISTATEVVSLMDQGTHTDVCLYQDTATETFVVVCDGETITEKVGVHDAQTSVDVFSENVETLTDTCHVVDKDCATDEDWIGDADTVVATCDVCNETRVITDTATSPIEVDDSSKFKFEKVNNQTQTSPIQVLNKLVSTSFDLDDESDGFKGLTISDAATSTENLPYIGLLSDTDCDELILVPEVAIDVIGSDLEYEKLLKESFPVPVSEASAQTIISSASLNIDAVVAAEAEYGIDMIKPTSDKLVTIGVNTDQKLTFEKETSTPTHHYITRSTTTNHHEKIDKATSTESYVRAMQDALMSPSLERSAKFYKIPKKDVCVETDSTLLDEKMIACINKLKTVSERLNSPTSRSPPEGVPWNKKQDDKSTSPEELIKELEKISEEDRKKTVLDLVAKSQAISKPKESKSDNQTVVRRKAQPITTLKAKYQEKVEKYPEIENKKIQESSNQGGLQNSKPVNKNGNGSCASPAPVQRKTAPNSRRNNSAPGRIATVPNPILRKGSPKTIPAASPKPSRVAQNITITTQEVTEPDFYSTVPKTRHPKHGLQSISESRPSSIGSEVSSASYRSAVSEPNSTSSSDILDFSSLKITVPPRTPSVSPTPQRHALKPVHSNSAASPNTASPPLPVESRKPRLPSKTKTEVVPTIEVEPDARERTGSTSSDQTDLEPSTEKKGLMKKLFGSKKKKSTEKRNASPSKSPKPGRKALDTPNPAQPSAPEVPKEKPKEKPKPFVYMRSRIFSIEQKDEDKYNKPIVNKYCVNEDEKPPVFDFAATFAKKK